ncbi:hypothetical protein U9M48_016581 [Paspalum notatum var. saurae]|uniref:F-box domain-containing protein n=1 Tax=Paspalum notatum var. saurae TaxID=547442 RepID=A0AAQ3T6F9_PASNO
MAAYLRMADAVTKRRGCCLDDGAGGIDALPEHLLDEVLSRVGDVKALFMFAVTCRRWLRRFADPAFLRRGIFILCPRARGGQGSGHATRLIGFLSKKTKLHPSPTFFPAPGSTPLGPYSRALASFASDDDTFNYADPLAARCGIVLVQRVPTPLETAWNPGGHFLGVCNLITGERHVLPLLDLTPIWADENSLCSYAIITPADVKPSSPPSGSFFKFSQLLLAARLYPTSTLRVYSYSAATRSWSEPTVCPSSYRGHRVDERSVVVHQGAAHWLYVDRCGEDDYGVYKLRAEVVAGTAAATPPRVSCAKLPLPARAGGGDKPLLCVSDQGKLVVAFVYMAHVAVWTQQGGDEDDGGTWTRTAAFVMPPAGVPSLYLHPPCRWIGCGRGSTLVMYRRGDVFTLDLETKVMEKVMDCPLPLVGDEQNCMCVPLEVDLVEFFVHHLGALCGGPKTN